ncbi:hypothetical protein [Salibacter halophilus]|uniref:Uncharacterized protein n=1 Tax=Salibacter halophilus TaxID=1803916 RepID=A0A6N6M8C3_9FLAO|nr:hypothetical protein [Salibacter halophilus]KAB1064898.1 hypothetical protein F3059_05970 [Salibacter halophilus]
MPIKKPDHIENEFKLEIARDPIPIPDDEMDHHHHHRHVTISISASYKSSSSDYKRPERANDEIKDAADRIISNSLSSVFITISTNMSEDQLGTPIGRNVTLNNLLWNRGRRLRQQLINEGVPPSSFDESNWLRFEFDSSPGLNISGE